MSAQLVVTACAPAKTISLAFTELQNRCKLHLRWHWARLPCLSSCRASWAVLNSSCSALQAAPVPQQQQVIMSAPQQGLGSGGMVVGGSGPAYTLAAMDGYQQGQGFPANLAGVPVPAHHHHQHSAQGYVATATGGTGMGWADQVPQQQQQQATEYADQDQAQGFVASGPAAAAGQQPGSFELQQGHGQGYTQHITGAGIGTGQGGQVAYAQSGSQGYQQGLGGAQAPLAQNQFSTPSQQSGSFVAHGIGLQVRPGCRTTMSQGCLTLQHAPCQDAASAQVGCCEPSHMSPLQDQRTSDKGSFLSCAQAQRAQSPIARNALQVLSASTSTCHSLSG